MIWATQDLHKWPSKDDKCYHQMVLPFKMCAPNCFTLGLGFAIFVKISFKVLPNFQHCDGPKSLHFHCLHHSFHHSSNVFQQAITTMIKSIKKEAQKLVSCTKIIPNIESLECF